MAVAVISLAAAVAVISLAVAAAASTAVAWDLLEAEVLSGRSVGWSDGHAQAPLATSGRMTGSPLSTERRRIVIQDATAGYRLQGGVLAMSETADCRLEFYGFLLEPFDPDPTQSASDVARAGRFYLIGENPHGARAILDSFSVTSDHAAVLRGAISHDGEAFVIMFGDSTTVAEITPLANPCDLKRVD